MPRHKAADQLKVSTFSKRVNSIVFYALLVLIVLAPIPLGSNRHWSWSLCALIASVLMLMWVANALWNQRNVSISLSPFVFLLFLFPVLWAMLQASSFTPMAMSHPLWAMSSELLDAPMSPRISITPDNSLIAVMRLISYGLIFFLSFQFCRNPHRALSMLKWLAIAGMLYALYGLVVHWGNINVLFWTEPAANENKTVTSTFINRNSYATYAGLGLLCLMALSLSKSSVGGAPYQAVMSRMETIEYYIFSNWKPLLGLMLITTALISTRSRGGFISAGPAVMVFLLIYGIKMKLNARMLFGSIGGVFMILLLAYSVSNEALLVRMDKIQLGGAQRLDVYKVTIDATRDSPVVGFGYGSYHEGFRMYRNEAVKGVYDKAHNTYLENIFELGIPAAVSLFMAFLSVLLLTLRGVIKRRRDWQYPATGVAATVLVGIHSLVDFSLQIPAVAIAYAAILGMAAAQSFSSSRHH